MTAYTRQTTFTLPIVLFVSFEHEAIDSYTEISLLKRVGAIMTGNSIFFDLN
ncbi:hypothetical protein VVMO6_01682 [Vibrio vulnificus MO6-24/O]|nr:hypothetical protein VVMO6_01682 [Vibrio vulnificus MO6-24/O]